MYDRCYHGGAFFERIGPEFDHLERRHEIINADVLDAWFPPSPTVVAALNEDLPWLLRTSPPTHCEGMTRVIARVRGVPAECVVPGAGSSALIFLAFRHWLHRSSRILILDPTYGEYSHILEKVIGCRVDRMPLSRESNYRVDLDELRRVASADYDLIVLVNPNSPTGQHVPRVQLEKLLRRLPATTRVWIDETYVEYACVRPSRSVCKSLSHAGQRFVQASLVSESLEQYAATAQNVVVCKSMSKGYALSGVRAAYLCGPERIIAGMRSVTPPWAVSLPAQVAAVAALQDPNYYAARYAETGRFRVRLAAQLALATRWEVIPGVANSILCHLPDDGPTSAEVVQRCRSHGLFLRDVSSMGQSIGTRALRITVKDAATNDRMIQVLVKSLTWDGQIRTGRDVHNSKAGSRSRLHCMG
jgi:histidinol-phosphate/aromatic aminotransferase/cobyric acid decarboxylase-like protein